MIPLRMIDSTTAISPAYSPPPPIRTRCPTARSSRTSSAARLIVATINLAALDVRDDLAVGHRVRIGGGGLYAGEIAVVESIILSGIIPAYMVRTEAGKSRRVRAVDLERVAQERP